ncbi:TPA: LysR family transcriptional regulator [Salmonella enterica subsp. enterica serovar Warragul]|nr:LysR family transcriptional regulator [Salmonella enterica subsp. enterica serovar Warragul]EHJ1770239.1 LysR family transcriptional regulator [Salmonella enterica]MIG50531.1 LysR family transcriptional regulator [Salmonella enterica subsp. enterica serovar Warragul]HEC6392306.1 LysR family transcriptional regulator [Salmonella enterica subsp. enterica serovar Warragul]
MIDWNDYWYFALIAEEGSYSRAAIRAQVSKSVLSRRMSALEEQLGVHLIQRTTRRLALTKVGEQFAQECQKLVNQSERARAVVQAVQEYPQGTLRISAPVFMAETWLGALINEFIARWPLANVQLLAVNRPMDMIAEGIDIALSVSSGALPDSSLHYKKINTLYDILVASPQWVEQHPDLKTIGDLHRAPAMVRLADGRMQSWHLINGSQEITLSLSPRLYSNNLRVLLQAVAGGNGVALLPFPACKEELQNGGLVQLFPEWSGQPRQIYALFPANKGMPAVARYFMDELTMRQEKLNSGHQKC